ncbi:AAA family ATPase [Myxococcota bacterium]|nr:AAA family ATPase [Myxococcota bacterium]MBU1429279.1 AAA family ATPase [Myxococcota bacterium]MBU1898942.1 AAA family ATPase [Myxococcota bacterium]
MATAHTCSICGAQFELRFAYQINRTPEGNLYFCSQPCHEKHLFSAQQKTCSVCGAQFELQFAYQQSQIDGLAHYFCSQTCRTTGLAGVQRRSREIRRIAVLNQKGGTGKTTTSVNLAAGLATKGYRVLLIDLDAQGNVAVSLGLRSDRTVYSILVEGMHPTDAIINVNQNLDALISNTSLAQAETRLVNTRDRYKVLSERMKSVTNYDFVIMDCGPSLSILNQNALTYADNLLIPVSCDYLSLVGVKQILRTLKKVNELLLQPVSILGVVPTFYNKQTRISIEAVQTLEAYFNDRVLPPIRSNTRLKEAPSHKQTIFEYAPKSKGSEDYMRLVERVLELCDLPSTSSEQKEPFVERAHA